MVETVSSLADWIRPGSLWEDIKNYVETRSGAKDTLEGIINVFDWMKELGFYKDFAGNASSQLEPIKQTLAVPGFVAAVGQMRDKWDVYTHSDAPEAFEDLVTSTAVATFNLSESAMAIDAWGIYALKEGMKAVKAGFWGSAGLIDTISFFKELGKADALNKKIEHIESPESKNVYEHKVQLCYLNVIKATTTIAMASIALISLFFASLAHGFIFSPMIFLSLASAWLILTYVIHFYGEMIKRWEKALPAGTAV